MHSADPDLAGVDDDLNHLFQSWFNPGFLVLRQIDWHTPADLLERLMRYEAVHRMDGWDDLRRRVLPADRRCYAFFHPALADDPVIFVEVSLTRGISGSIAELLAPDRQPIAAEEATAAIFYSISNCQPGLKGISFGNVLIKDVVEELRRTLPRLDTFVTLSPLPGFRRWLAKGDRADTGVSAALAAADAGDLMALETVREPLMQLGRSYLLQAKTGDGRPTDSVQRFHLGNGARIERLCWMADPSPKGVAESAALMVNYLYDFDRIGENQEAFAVRADIATGRAFARDVRQDGRRAATAPSA
jgi:malonyl-CoA decarboxylase